MALLGDDFDVSVPADNTAVRLGAQRIREIKERLKAWAATIGSPSLGGLNTDSVTSAMLKRPTGNPAGFLVPSLPSGGTYTFNRFEKNDQGQIVAADFVPLTVGTANLADGSVTLPKLAAAVIMTQVRLADAEVTPEKMSRPSKWIRWTYPATNLTLDTNSATPVLLVTATLATHPYKIGDRVTIISASKAPFNGTFTILTTPTADTFTYSMLTTSSGTATGGVLQTVEYCSYSLAVPFANATSISGAAVSLLSGWHAGGGSNRDPGGSEVTVTVAGIVLTDGDHVRISGCANAAYNGEFYIYGVTGAGATFNYFAPSAAVGATTGTIRVQKLVRDLTVARSGLGNYTITFATPFPDLNYSVEVAAQGVSALTADLRIAHYYLPALASIKVITRESAASILSDGGCSAVFRS